MGECVKVSCLLLVTRRSFTSNQQQATRTGFTLIELVIVVTILAILAAVAIPVFQNLQTQARNAATRGALAGMREAIQHYRMNEIVSGRQPGTPLDVFPDNGCPDFQLASVKQGNVSGPWVLENGSVPENPWARGVVDPGRENYIEFVTGNAPLNREVWTGMKVAHMGWRYQNERCEIWANTAENGGPVTENLF